MSKNYTVLHIHTEYSSGTTNIDSVTTYKDYAKKAKECNMKSMAISEHGNFFAWVSKKREIESHGMKYIHAQEFYVTETLKEKIRDNFHCLLIARNYDGVIELNSLSSQAFNRDTNNFYYVPRISIDDVLSTSDNIIVLTGCLGGILNKGNKEVKNKFFKFLRLNKDRCFLEIQPHIFQEQKKYNQMLYELSEKYNIPLVMTTDTHALNEKHLKGRSILQKAKNVYFEGEDEFDLIFKTYNELVECCKKQNALPMDVYLRAIENTNVVADMVKEFKLDYSFKYPKLWGDNSEKIIRQKIREGIQKRGIDTKDNIQEYLDRIEYEMLAFKHNQALDFLLLMTDVVDFCVEKDIGLGYGRGSVNGSIIAYLLGITEMDSVIHKLNADRFISVAKISLSDVDTDFPPSRVNEVKNYLFQKHGLVCADIITFNTIALKGAIRDCSRALGYDLKLVNDICNNIENKEEELRDKHKELFEYVDLVNGTIVSVGSHPCGVVTSVLNLPETIGTFTTSTSNYPISQINMKEIDSLNYVKLDLLKLDTIEIINETCKLANIERLTPDNIDLTDINLWKEMRDDTTQIFQWEGSTGDSYIKQLFSDKNLEKINYNIDKMITMMSIGNSAIRPAGASYRNDLAKGILKDYGSDVLNSFLEPTLSYLVFQETIIDFLHEYCGFTKGEADIVRRQFAKKTGTESSIPIIKNGGRLTEDGNYIKGFIQTMQDKYDMSKSEAENIIDDFLVVINDASSYLFSLNHSHPYTYMGLASAYLRYYYPIEFLTTALNVNRGNEDKTHVLINYAKKKKIKISLPKFRKAKDDYFFDKNNNIIYIGISSIKNIGKSNGEDLYALKDNVYNTFMDLLLDIKQTSVNSKQLDILIKLDFFEEFGDINYLLEVIKWFDLYYKSKTLNKAKLTEYELECLQGCYSKKTEKQYKEINNNKFIHNLISRNPPPTITTEEKMNYQIELLGYTNITDPKSKYYAVTDVQTNSWGTPFITLYRIKDGKSKQLKADKKYYTKHKLKAGDIIRCSFDKKNKVRKVEDKWVDTGEIEHILKVWSIQGTEEDRVIKDDNVFHYI